MTVSLCLAFESSVLALQPSSCRNYALTLFPRGLCHRLDRQQTTSTDLSSCGTIEGLETGAAMAVPSPDLGLRTVRLPILDPSLYRSLKHLASTAGRYPVPRITPTTRPGHDDLYRDQHCLVGCSASRGCTCRKCAHVSVHRRPRSSLTPFHPSRR